MSASAPEPTKGAIRRVALADIARMHADGERIAALPLTVEVAPLALRVLVP